MFLPPSKRTMAGVSCLENILSHKHKFDITIFGDETHANYNRILLSSVLSGEREADEITINGIDWYQKANRDLQSRRPVRRFRRGMPHRGGPLCDGIVTGNRAPSFDCGAVAGHARSAVGRSFETRDIRSGGYIRRSRERRSRGSSSADGDAKQRQSGVNLHARWPQVG